MKINWLAIGGGMLFVMWWLSSIAIFFGGIGYVLVKLEHALS